MEKNEKEMKKKFRSFEEARKFARSLNLETVSEWDAAKKSRKIPSDIPKVPWRTYKNQGWEGFGDWLGTGRVADQFKQYRPFEEARTFAHSLKLKGQKDWRKYCRSGNKPDDIPTNPHSTYKKQFSGYGDWLGTGSIASRNRKFKPFAEARKFIHSLQLRGGEDWRKYFKSKKMPIDIPSHPHIIYKKDWVSWGDWFGTGRVATNIIKNQYRKFSDARKFMHTLGLKSANEFRKQAYHYPRKIIQVDIPSHPYIVYKKDWVSWGDWLGTGTVATTKIKYREFSDARKFVHALGLKTLKEWQRFSRSGKRPSDIPGNPAKSYKKEWKGYGDWIGTGAVATRNIIYRPFPEAKKFIRSLGMKNLQEWKEYLKSGKKPDDIPAAPWEVYSIENVLRRMKKK